jgi:hypothetical protein
MSRLLSKRLIPWLIVFAGFGVAIVVWIVFQRIESEESRWEVVLAVKADGSFYLPSEPTVPVTSELLKNLLHTANPPHCVIAFDNSCPVKEIGPVVTVITDAGFALYQLRTPEYRLNLSLQERDYFCGFNASKPLQRWVDLRENATDRIFEAPDRPDQSDDIETSTEVAVLTDPDLPVDELIKASALYAVPGKSMGIHVLSRYPDGELQLPTLELFRHRFEDEAHRYIPPPPSPFVAWMNKWWKTTKDTVNSWF